MVDHRHALVNATGSPVARRIIDRQIEEACVRLDVRFWAIFLSGYDHSPLGRITGLFPHLPVVSAADEDVFCEAVQSIAVYLDACGEAAERAAKLGRTPWAASQQQAIKRWQALLDDGGQHLIPEGASDDLKARARQIFETVAKPSIAAYAARLQTTWDSPRGNATPGLVHIPDGREDYERLAALHTDYGGSVETIHKLGETQVTQLIQTLSDLTSAVPCTSVEQMLSAQEGESRYNTREELTSAFETLCDHADACLGKWFSLQDVQPFRVQNVPAHLSEVSPPAYYVPRNGSAPGMLMLNFTDMIGQPVGSYDAMFFHEAIPGHHLQFEVACTSGLPDYRRAAWFNAFIEGWGLYCEELAGDASLYNTKAALRSKIAMELLRAMRLVVDTGLHAYGWSVERAEARLMSDAGLSAVRAKAEVARYVEYPGQALSYAMGKARIMALRDDVRASAGPSFKLKTFHHEVLRHGPVPLDILSKEVTQNMLLKEAKHATIQ